MEWLDLSSIDDNVVRFDCDHEDSDNCLEINDDSLVFCLPIICMCDGKLLCGLVDSSELFGGASVFDNVENFAESLLSGIGK